MIHKLKSWSLHWDTQVGRGQLDHAWSWADDDIVSISKKFFSKCQANTCIPVCFEAIWLMYHFVTESCCDSHIKFHIDLWTYLETCGISRGQCCLWDEIIFEIQPTLAPLPSVIRRCITMRQESLVAVYFQSTYIHSRLRRCNIQLISKASSVFYYPSERRQKNWCQPSCTIMKPKML